MSNLLVFTPQHELDFQKNYDEFISFAKNDLTLFEDCEENGKKGWECGKWYWIPASEKRSKLSIVFGKSTNSYNYIEYKQPFLDFAKAYARYNQSIQHKDSTSWFSGFDWLYEELAENAVANNKDAVDIMHLNNNVINNIEKKIRSSSLSDGSKRYIALSLQSILKFIRDQKFKLNLQVWKNPFPRPTDSTIKLDKKSQLKEEDKCPSDYQMLQVASAFNKAQTPKQKYYTSLCVMLLCQPSRSVELTSLTLHSLQKSQKGRMYLMWYPVKSGSPVKKWVPKLLETVVTQAFEILIKISAPARKAALFAYENPGKFMMHAQCSTPQGFPNDKGLSRRDFANAMGFKSANDDESNTGWSRYKNTKWLNELIDKLNDVTNWQESILPSGSYLSNENVVVFKDAKGPSDISIKVPSYHDLRTFVDNSYKNQDFPNYGCAKIWECITLVRENEFHKTQSARPFSWIPVGHGMISDAIGSERIDGMKSVFDELDITDEDGSPLCLTTHQFRHWLNTKLKLAGEEDWIIAKWSGRADLKQNKAYDGRTPEQRSRLINRIGSVSDGMGIITVAEASNLLSTYTSEVPPPALLLHDLNLPVSLKALGVDRTGVAQFSGMGYCLHNYAESPCMKNGQCETCSEHACLKGIPNTLEELKNLANVISEQFEAAKKDAENNVYNADRWVTPLAFQLTKIKTIIAMLEDPRRPDGSVVRVVSELDPSAVKLSLNPNRPDFLSASQSQQSTNHKAIPVLDLMSLALAGMEES